MWVDNSSAANCILPKISQFPQTSMHFLRPNPCRGRCLPYAVVLAETSNQRWPILSAVKLLKLPCTLATIVSTYVGGLGQNESLT